MVCIQCFSTSDAAAKAEKHPVEVCMDKDFTLSTDFPNSKNDLVSYAHKTVAAWVSKVFKINTTQLHTINIHAQYYSAALLF